MKGLLPLGLLLATTPAFAADREIEQAVDAVYAPYFADIDDLEATPPAWEQPVYSRGLTDLIARWRETVPVDEVDALSDSDWLCQCQDWDASTFSTEVVDSRIKADTATARVLITIFPGAQRTARFAFVREDGVWKVDDLVTPEMPEGLRRAVTAAIDGDAN
ncbi:hypothetical protein B2G71_07890 [Novosphingobium sp. PC22D]|uniref:DUF3828 domain-containing protein n=1 Tax=Novosphingobium sp. PC22D TaxID=1962403 RepID=UPI000BFAC826|nr:DUF3828 domain-containing protein [Novosphingobium sp. PC22D]PEQ13346.1 hypothetical protein B2G71_07890 [Novosphingobium sp. PC22D]